jgi:predicted TIM-barrel enzyme
MAKRFSRDELNAKLRQTIKEKKPIIIGGAGDGFTAKLEDKGGVDIVGIYNSGRFRHFGAGSLSGLMPVGRNNQMVFDYAGEVCSMVKEAAVISGFCAQDTRTIWDKWCSDMSSFGVSGFMNFPTVGLIDADSNYRKNLEESGLGYSKEIEVLKIIHELGYFTIGYCFTPEEARLVAGAGVDILACHVGLTAGGLIGAETIMDMEKTIKTTKELIDAAKEVRKEFDFIPITHGGIMEDPETTEPVLKGTEAVGYLGASSIERNPVEPAIINICKDFKKMPINIPNGMKL